MRRIVLAHRAAMATRQCGVCEWCDEPLHDIMNGDAVHIDHIDPILGQEKTNSRKGALRRSHYSTRKGWAAHSDNLRLLHADCNLERGGSPRLTPVPF